MARQQETKERLASSPLKYSKPEQTTSFFNGFLRGVLGVLEYFNGLLVVTGEYGTGKTALTKILQYRWLNEHKTNPVIPLPFRLELRNFTRQFDARGLLHNFLDNNGLSHISIEFVESLIKTGRIILLLDGYDEMAQYLNSRERRACLEALAELSSGGAKGIITSRPNYFTETEELQIFEILYDSLKSSYYLSLAKDLLDKEKKIDSLLAQFIDRYERSLKDLSPEQTEALISKVLVGDPKGKEVVLGILRKVFRSLEHGDQISLSGKPVIISYLLEIVEGLKKSPDEAQSEQLSEWQIYKMIVDQLMLRDLARSPEINPGDRRRVLQKLALHLSRKDTALIAEEDFKDLVSKEFRKDLQRMPIDSRSSHIERLFADLRSSGTLTRASDPNRHGWRFSHNSLREYLVAEHLLEGLRAGQVVGEPVPVSDAMRLFCASMPDQDKPKMLELLASEWQKPENRRGCSQLLSLLWDAFRPLFVGEADSSKKVLNRITGDPIALNNVDLSRMSLSSELTPVFLEKANFSGSSLSNVDFGFGKLMNCDFTSAYLENVKFSQTIVEGCVFCGSMLVDCEFSGSTVATANFAGIEPDDISIIVETDDVEAFKGGLRRLSGEYALGFLNYAGAITNPVPDFAVYCHHEKFPIAKKILEKLSEQTLRQRMGLEQRGAARADVPFAKQLIQCLEDSGFIVQSKRRKNLVEVTEVGRERLTEYVRTGRLPAEIVQFLKAN